MPAEVTLATSSLFSLIFVLLSRAFLRLLVLLLFELPRGATFLHLLVLDLIEARVVPLVFGVGLARMLGRRGLVASAGATPRLVVVVPLVVCMAPTSVIATLATSSRLVVVLALAVAVVVASAIRRLGRIRLRLTAATTTWV